jgi:diguanylate cyclase (GGDEF)-like protein
MTTKRILIVEDERIVAMDVRGALIELGYEIVGIAASCADALAKAEEFRPDLVLMDVRLDGATDGIATAALLRERYGVAIVYLTANADPTTLGRALADAPGGFLTKPFSPATLHATIEVALRREEAESRRMMGHEALEAALRLERENLISENAELARETRALEQLVVQLREDATVDPLTGLHNRRDLDIVLARELSLAQRRGFHVGLIMLDLDYFKSFNDTYGHVAGDAALKVVADALRAGVRVFDSLFRYGGEELVVVAPGAGAVDAFGLAERLRSALAALVVDVGGRVIGPVTASFGVASAPEHGATGAALLNAADEALYAAKAAGRNRVVMARSPTQTPG